MTMYPYNAHNMTMLIPVAKFADLNDKIKSMEADNARLKAEVERLRASSFVTAVPSHQYERIVKAGDAMASTLQFEETLNDSDRIPQSVQNWNAAKNGWDDDNVSKQP